MMAPRRNKPRGKTISLSVEVDTNVDVDLDVSELSDEDLKVCVDEAARRKIINSDARMPAWEYVELAWEELMRNRPAEALCMLERARFPSTAAKQFADLESVKREGSAA